MQLHRHARSLVLISLCMGCLLSCGEPEPEVEVESHVSSNATTTTPTLNSAIPFDVTIEGDPDNLQPFFDEYSWQTFVALNWPALANGQADPSQQPGQNGDNATVWEDWRESSTIFLAGGAQPAPWGSTSDPSTLPPICRDLFKPGMRVMLQVGKTPGLLSESIEPFDTGPLIDQNGRYARFEILVNESMFDTIFDQSLYSKAGQEVAGDVVFDCGDNGTQVEGAMMVKAAWKILSTSEIQSGRFHATEALVYTPPSEIPKVDEKCVVETVGLVGLHIAHKTKNAPQWIWSTFEHVDNCPTDGKPHSQDQYSFYNTADPDAPKNTPPARPWDPNATEPPDRRPQVVRMIPIDEPTQQLNASWQAALRAVNPNSVWQYYELVSTQWPTQPADDCDVKSSAPTNPSGSPTPQFLANTTLETYIQGTTPNVSSSCIECHLNATTTTAKFSDFTYLLERAQ